MVINVHAGHNPDGKAACGAIGLIKESTEARNVVKYMIEYLKAAGHTVYDCTENNGSSSGDVLRKIVSKCNAHKVDLDVSIHFNAGVNDRNGNKRTTGCETLIYNSSSASASKAKAIVNKIAALGFTNRGVKTRTDLYYLKSTKSPSVLVECCFVDDKDDVELYNAKTMAKAIVEGIIGGSVSESTATSNTSSSSVKSNKSQLKIDNKIYNVESIVNNGSTFVKLRDFEQAGYTIGYENGVPSISKN